MKNKAVAVLTAISILIAGLTGCQTATKSYGGKTTIKLEPNQKLEEITWKYNKYMPNQNTTQQFPHPQPQPNGNRQQRRNYQKQYGKGKYSNTGR